MAQNSNGKQSIPALFIEIIRNDAALDELLARKAIPFFEANSRIETKRAYIKAAEERLVWNTDKGNTNKR